MRQQIATLAFVASLLLPAATVFSASETSEVERQPPGDDDIENIVITGQRPEALRRLMLDFIVEIGDPASRSRGYARWRNRFCVGVYNLPDARAAQYIADKITVTALDLGLQTGSPGCVPDVRIVFSPDSRSLATTLVEESPGMFRPFGGVDGTTQGLAALEAFKSSDAPVRWWQITMVVDELGFPAVELPGWNGVPVIRGIASRLKAPISDALWGSLIIVDAGKLDAVAWPQLADYLALVSLAQIDPNGRPGGYDSILNLFSASKPPAGMTEMDRSYLRALYEMDTMTFPHAQRGIFSHRMVRELRELEAGK